MASASTTYYRGDKINEFSIERAADWIMAGDDDMSYETAKEIARDALDYCLPEGLTYYAGEIRCELDLDDRLDYDDPCFDEAPYRDGYKMIDYSEEWDEFLVDPWFRWEATIENMLED